MATPRHLVPHVVVDCYNACRLLAPERGVLLAVLARVPFNSAATVLAPMQKGASFAF